MVKQSSPLNKFIYIIIYINYKYNIIINNNLFLCVFEPMNMPQKAKNGFCSFVRSFALNFQANVLAISFFLVTFAS